MNIARKVYDAKIAYYYGNPMMTDEEYDSLEKKLKKKNPGCAVLKMVGAPVPGKNKAKHQCFMGSLNNAMNLEKLFDFIENMKIKYGYGDLFSFSDKLDGASLEVMYKDNKFIQAITRGDGREGQDVTINVVKSRSVKTIQNDGLFERMSIKCEAVIHKDDLIKINEILESNNEKIYSNCRNAASGILQREDSKFSEYLKIYAYDCEDFNDILVQENSKFEFLAGTGFLVPRFCLEKSIDKVEELVNNFMKDRRELKYDVDGIVVRVNETELIKLEGYKSGRPVCAVAYKYPAEEHSTKIKSVNWQTGRNGTMTPVARVKPVNIGGAIVRNATLHNMGEIERLGVAINDKVVIIRSGDVIPKITGVLRKSKKRMAINPPEICKACGSEGIEKEGAHYFCRNVECGAQVVGRIMNWINCRNIMHLNKGIIEAMYDNEMINSIIDLYNMDVNELSTLYLENGVLGVKRAKKIIEEIDKSRNITIGEFHGSLGIPNLGVVNANKIVKYFEMNNWEDFYKLGVMTGMENVNGIGPEIQEKVNDYLDTNKNDIYNLAEKMNFIIPKETNISGKTFCITGTLSKPRDEIVKLITNAGGEVKGFSKKLDYLVVGDKPGSKLEKAKSTDIKVIGEGELNTLVIEQ